MDDLELTETKDLISKSLAAEFSEAFKRFKGKNELIYKEGANEPGCPKNYIRGDIPRKFSPHLRSGKQPKNRYPVWKNRE